MSNDNTTNSFEELTFPSLLKKYDKILIPMIQRDYAQGRSDEKAQEVRTNLLKDIFEKESVHFDLIFGSCEKRKENNGEKQCFIPVDGQQRLTTLFLLHLYAQKLGRNDEELDLSKFSYDTRRAAADFCNKVTAEPWIVEPNKKVSETIKDSVWFMNYWENDPTVEGMLNMLDAIHNKANETNAKGIDFPNLDKIKIYFFDLESNGLNENLYLKMNSRGKPLTAFENLKASIEKVLPDNLESDGAQKCFPENAVAPESFKDKWKFFMDRDWTNAFWNSEKPEVTDNNITAFIVRFLSGYYNAFSNSNDENVVKETNNKLKEINSKNNYADFIPFEPIRESLTSEAFKRLALAFTTIADADNKIKPSWNETIKTTDYHEYKIIAVVFAYVLFDGNPQAMRVAWNLAENTVSGYDNFIAYCKRIREIFSNIESNKKEDIYHILATTEFNNPSAQLIEEIVKAQKIQNSSNLPDGKSWEKIIIEAEKYAFFKGAIRFLFTKDNIGDDWNDFNSKLENAQKYFDENGVKETYQTNAYLLRYYISNFKEWWMFWNFEYDNKPTTWKSLLTSNRYSANHNILINSLEENHNFSDFKPSLEIYDDGYKDLQYSVQEELVKTHILVEASKWHSKLNWRYNTYCLYPSNARADRKKYVIGNHRNRILSDLCDKKVIIDSEKKRFKSGESNNFFWGWDINFRYTLDNNIYDFQWNADGNIYLIENNERKKKADGTDYCFPTKGINNSDSFKDELDKLICEATTLNF